MLRHSMGMERKLLACALGAASALILAGCATPAGSDLPTPVPGSYDPIPPAGDVVGTGMVMDAGEPELCLGPVAESYPPQCAGIPLEGWSWDGVEGFEESEGTRWGTYAVQGTYDGDSLTVTEPPIMLALYSPMAPPDPTGGEPGEGADEVLAAIQEELPSLLGDDLLSSYSENGWLWVDVIWDDGTIQQAVDAAYGDDIVAIRSALREVG